MVTYIFTDMCLIVFTRRGLELNDIKYMLKLNMTVEIAKVKTVFKISKGHNAGVLFKSLCSRLHMCWQYFLFTGTPDHSGRGMRS